ncbi:hypothetical protein HANVADRAFT_52521 [Hanseniaspora valbyensis NRRL Y-1626]|uniref:Activator of Hsp90 ATPase AHSA1-like N-terminal domain-containing protein n=1 Tax=Hanseniaspora valbyensis NRRL Y-1626 TaxID=766949 RepID=A0A1B7TEU6_9ASCO|nr:hypothetical protein HANVADRAFT_52521 [Hanseniaspora valbyensis NRRL Y-1626]
MVINVNNWHWTDKNCLPWAKEYFQRVLENKIFKASSSDITLTITKMSQLEGDCEVNQRKGKLMSLFDMQMVLDFDVESEKDSFAYSGTIKIPEIAFDSEVESYQYELTILKEKSDDSFKIREFFKNEIKKELSAIFYKFNDDLLEENAKDIQLDAEKVTSTYTAENAQKAKLHIYQSLSKKESTETSKNEQSSATTPSKPVKVTTETTTTTATTSSKQNTTTIKFQETFTTRASQLFEIYISPQFINAWSRGTFHPIKISSSGLLKVGDEYGLFNDNITTTIKELNKKGDAECEIVMGWRLSDWAAKQESELCLKFHESSEFGETTMEVIWGGVPLGQEDRVRDRFREVYVRGVKIMFGFGMVL